MKRLFLFLAVLFFCGRVLAINEVPVIIILGQSNADGSAGIGSWSPSIEGATLAQRDVSLGFEGFVANNPDYKMKMWHRNVRCNPNGWRNPVVRDAVNLGTPGWKYLSYKTELAKNRSAMSIGSDDWNGSGVDLNQRGIEGGLMLEWGTVKGTKSELYVLKVGVQGSYIGSWTTVADETNWIYFRDKIAKEAFTDLLKQGKTPVLAGVWWMQGESDKGATTEYYQNCLGELINKCATQLGFTAPPFYIGQIAVGTGSYDANIRRAQQNLIDANPNNVFFSVTDGLAMGDPDKVHFTYQSYSTIGKNLADAVIGNSAKWGEFSTKVNRWIKTTQQINHLSDVAIELWNIEPTAVTYEYEVGGTWLPISGVTTVGTYPVRANITVGSYLETITGGTLTVEASSVIYVDGDAVSSGDGKSWASAKKSLSEAITSAPSGGEIWIKGSTNGIQYNNAGQINISSGLSIYGGFAGDETNLVGRDAKKNRVIVKQINTTANATNRVFNITADNVTIDGITITGGKCDGTTNSTGGGAMIVNGQNFHLNNCVVEDNSATAGVGGLMLINSAGAKVENTIFSSNWSGWCGFAANIGTTTVSNCLFYNNGCQWSGVTISVMDAAATINVYNSTFIKSVSTNAPSDQACAIYSDKGSINIFNSVLLGNNGCDAWLNSGILTMENCAYENVNNITPTGSITLTSAKAPENFVKPGFTTKATNVYAYSNFKDYDFALKDGAALFNKGNNTNTCGAALDIAGNTRIMYGIVDIGAYEYADVNPKAITGTVTNLGSSTATLNGSYLNITPLTVGFQYKLASEDWASAKFVQASIITTPYSVDITGLIKDADYVVRAVASDDKTTLNGIEVLFKTSLWGVENEITNETELTAFRTWINSGNTGAGITWKLTNDITLTSWSASIGTATTAFQGIFDGNGHTISNLTFTSSATIRGLFHTIAGNAVVSNLGIQSGTIDASAGGTGCIAGFINGSSKIENCYNRANVTGNGWEIGGIAGWAKNGTPQIINCYNSGNIEAVGDCAGILGYSDCYPSIINCYNIGSIPMSGGYSDKCGSIFGKGGITITNCYFLSTGKRSLDDAVSLSKTESELKATGIVALLNGAKNTKVWGGDQDVMINNGYPIFKWQGGRDVVAATVSANINGTAIGTVTCWAGSEVTATATANAGYEFKNWTSDAAGDVEISAVNPYVFTATEDKTIYANFKISTGIEDVSATGVRVFVSGNQLIVAGVELSTLISVYDTAGRLLISQSATEDMMRFSIDSGKVYIVHVNTEVFKIGK